MTPSNRPRLILLVCRLKDVTEGACKIPFMKELETGKWYHDSDFMVSYLEDKYPKRKIGKPDTDPQVYVLHFFPSFPACICCL